MSISERNLIELHKSFLTGKSDIDIMPIYYTIEPTNWCNYSCPICPNRLYNDDDKGYMNIDLFDNIIEQVKDFAEIIQLYWVGEPLLHPDLYKMVSICREKTKSKIMLSTNGYYLDADAIDKLVENGLYKLIVSIDANDTNEVYHSMRRGGDIQRINANVEILEKYIDSLDITLQFIQTYSNKKDKEPFIEKWSNKGFKTSIQPLYTWANQLCELNDKSDYLSPMIGKTQTPCSDLWYRFIVHWNGKVSRCCFDWSFNNVIGDLKEQTVLEIWNSDIINQIRQNHINLAFDTLCSCCDAWAVEEEYATLFD